jgi:hypothetical protein
VALKILECRFEVFSAAPPPRRNRNRWAWARGPLGAATLPTWFQPPAPAQLLRLAKFAAEPRPPRPADPTACIAASPATAEVKGIFAAATRVEGAFRFALAPCLRPVAQ